MIDLRQYSGTLDARPFREADSYSDLSGDWKS